MTLGAEISTPNYYQILSVSASASQEELRLAYRRLAKIYHPDVYVNGDETFKKINDAYSVLRNPARRRLYDASLAIDISISKVPDATDRERFYNIVISLCCFAVGICLWVLGDKPGPEHQGYLVFLGWVCVLYSFVLCGDRDKKLLNPLTPLKKVFLIFLKIFIWLFSALLIGLSLWLVMKIKQFFFN